MKGYVLGRSEVGLYMASGSRAPPGAPPRDRSN